MVQPIGRYYHPSFPKPIDRMVKFSIEFDRGVKQESAFYQADNGHPRPDFHTDKWQLERPFCDPEVPSYIAGRPIHLCDFKIHIRSSPN
jgi:hypothetical protein